MLIEVLCICRRPPAWVRDATSEYARRLPRDFTLTFTYLTPARDRAAAVGRRDEGARLLKRNGATPLIALDERGVSHTSTEFAAGLARARASEAKIAFAIGGADGLDKDVLNAAAQCWSLSRLTLPHLLVQVVLAEQIYRAWSIIEQHPYHRA